MKTTTETGVYHLYYTPFGERIEVINHVASGTIDEIVAHLDTCIKLLNAQDNIQTVNADYLDSVQVHLYCFKLLDAQNEHYDVYQPFYDYLRRSNLMN